ncbi:hypothetical protein LZ24_01754 [Desulfobotulus alkaliphilus]|uniref:Alginate export domain-containing protein n=1 Tax=Desulfobotulus alkaliphilus TaxID=622671 RepID=A0A562RRQ5_9BACT|nr:DUF1302 family protein [Desulfobotulus alkaliphilus]TWI71738.1 hypothetical protein LZ24_01754 [Desulfobotulus alkaliphilus]
MAMIKKTVVFLILALYLAASAMAMDDDDDLDFTELLGTSLPGSTAPAVSMTRPFLFEGELRPSVWYSLKDPHDVHTTNRLDLLMEAHMKNTSFVARLRGDYQDIENKDAFTGDIRELYIQQQGYLKRTYLSFSAGRKILHWGKGDEIRPMDRICPEDMRAFLYYDKNDRKAGLTGLFLESALPGGLRVEAFWSPVFVGSDMPDHGSYFTSQRMQHFSKAGGRIIESDDDWTWDSQSSMGLRIGLPLKRADASLYAWRGKDPMPMLKVSEVIRQIPINNPPYYMNIPPAAMELSWFHSDAVVFGADFEASTGAWVFRTEGAWQTKGHYEMVDFEKDPLLLNDFPEGLAEKQKGEFLIGLDRNDLFFRNLFVNVQYLGVYIHDHEKFMERDAYTQGASFTMKYSAFDSRISTLWRVFAWMNSQDRQHQVEASWRPFSNTLLTAGAFFYSGGGERDMFGQFRDKDFTFLRGSVIF